MKKILGVRQAPPAHWVGDGFPVRSLFTYQHLGRELSPFLMLDYGGPATFEPATKPRGVGAHPHRGFETVTIVYQGEVAHRDSAGGGGVIGPGDVQWMTAGAGIVHDEFHSPEFTRAGGVLEMVQLWVNLPARHKMAAPSYQAITRAQIPTATLPDGAGTVRVIAGELDGQAGPARTHTPMHVWEVRLPAGARTTLRLPDGWGGALVLLRGEVQLAGGIRAKSAELAVLDRAGSDVVIEAVQETTALLLSGEPIDEPIVGYGPFVMNDAAQIREAIDDYNKGRFTPAKA